MFAKPMAGGRGGAPLAAWSSGGSLREAVDGACGPKSVSGGFVPWFGGGVEFAWARNTIPVSKPLFGLSLINNPGRHRLRFCSLCLLHSRISIGPFVVSYSTQYALTEFSRLCHRLLGWSRLEFVSSAVLRGDNPIVYGTGTREG